VFVFFAVRLGAACFVACAGLFFFAVGLFAEGLATVPFCA
jgi:hypothetical protein